MRNLKDRVLNSLKGNKKDIKIMLLYLHIIQN